MGEEPIADGVGYGGFTDDFVPGIKGTLGGHDGGRFAPAVFEDFKKRESVGRLQLGKAKIIEDEDIHFREGPESLFIMVPISILPELGP